VGDLGARKRRAGSGVACVLLLCLTVGALGHVGVHIKHLEIGLALGKARREAAELEEQRRRLSLEIGVLKDPHRIMTIAGEKLGLAPPSAGDIVSIAALGGHLSARFRGEDGKQDETQKETGDGRTRAGEGAR
jgi:cell division protein FtsL